MTRADVVLGSGRCVVCYFLARLTVHHQNSLTRLQIPGRRAQTHLRLLQRPKRVPVALRRRCDGDQLSYGRLRVRVVQEVGIARPIINLAKVVLLADS